MLQDHLGGNLFRALATSGSSDKGKKWGEQVWGQQQLQAEATDNGCGRTSTSYSLLMSLGRTMRNSHRSVVKNMLGMQKIQSSASQFKGSQGER